MTDIGSVLGGRYRLVELLGQGGMASIYRARDVQLDRDVAVKLLLPELGRDPDFLARFRDEARAAASLSHPNVVAVFDYGQDASGPYLVMELVEGEDLASILREMGPLAPRQAARIAAEVAKALHAAHLARIVHRDVKPSNILIARDGRVKVADFGIARAVTETQLTLPGRTLGSVHYFSPEQARGEPATATSDIYALGVVLFEMLTGKRPFAGDGAAAVALARLTATVPPPSALRSAVPPALDGIVARAMALDPAARFPSAVAMAGALEGFLDETARAAGARPAAPAAGPAAAPVRPAPVVADPGEEPPARTGPWAWLAGLLGLVVLAAIGFLAFRFLIGGASPSPTPEQVVVPSFVGMSFADAETLATQAGLTLVRAATEESAEVQPDTVLEQDPPADTSVARGSEVRLTLAIGTLSVAVPDLRGDLEADALQALVQATLQVGTRTEAYDPFVPAGSIVSTDPAGGLMVAPGTRVAYVVSKGPEPSASPSPTPTPTPTPTPVAPTPGPRNTGNYVCLSFADARAAIADDGFTLGLVTTTGGAPTDAWLVVAQDPAPATREPYGAAIDLVVAPPDSPCPAP